MNHLKRLEVSMTAGSSSTLRFYRKKENTRKKGGHELRSSILWGKKKEGERYDAYIRSTPGD